MIEEAAQLMLSEAPISDNEFTKELLESLADEIKRWHWTRPMAPSFVPRLHAAPPRPGITIGAEGPPHSRALRPLKRLKKRDIWWGED